MNLGPSEIILIILVIILLFGAKKLPDLARSVGRSMRIFKSEVKEMANDDENPPANPTQQAPQTQLPPGQIQPPAPGQHGNYGQQGNYGAGNYGPGNYGQPDANGQQPHPNPNA